MAIPGPVTSRASTGVHEAMRTGQAMVVTSGADVVEAISGLGAEESGPGRAQETFFDAMSPAMQRMLDAVPWSPPRPLAEIAGELRVSPSSAQEQLVDLERKGFVARVPQGWMLLRRADLA